MLKKLEEQKAELLESIAGWSCARLAYSPAPNQWSTVEMFDHIVKVESDITAVSRKGLLEPHPLGVRDRLGFLLVDRIFRSDRRVKVPQSASTVLPDTNLDLDSIKQRWHSDRQKLKAFIEGLRPDQMQAGVFRHPISGWMSVPQVLQFFSSHMQHHTFQLARLRTASRGL